MAMRMIRPLFIAMLAVLIFACSTRPTNPFMNSTPLPALDADHPEQTRFGPLEYRGGLRLASEERGFGGWSAARLDGNVLTSISDVGYWLRLTLVHEGGRLTDARREAGGRLRRLDGELIGKHKDWADAEGLTRWRDGWVASFERNHRLWYYGPDVDGIPVQLAAPAGMARLEKNLGVETIANLADGRLLLLAEEGGDGWLGTPEDWHPVTWAMTGDFKPTDAVQLPSGDVVVLERRFSIIGGFSARLSLLSLDQIKPGAYLQGRELLRLEPPLIVDNFEGLAVGRGPAGETMLYLISDDNFSALQATLLLAFAFQ